MGDSEYSSDSEESKPTLCKYCSEICEPYQNPSLKCGTCRSSVHIRCLRRGGVPGGLIGDVFFDLTCQECHHLGEETLVRQRISWLGIVILALYNLRAKSGGISNRGFFHWNQNVNAFVERNWDILAAKNVKLKKNWKGTVSGALSHASKKGGGLVFFQSGFDVLGDAGYWKLIDSDPPEVLISRNERAINDRKRQSKSQQQSSNNNNNNNNNNNSNNSNNSNSNNFCQRSVNSSAGYNVEESSSDSPSDSSRTVTPSMFSREYVQPSEILSDCLFADDEAPETISQLSVKSIKSYTQQQDPQVDFNKILEIKSEDLNHLKGEQNQHLDSQFIVPDKDFNNFNNFNHFNDSDAKSCVKNSKNSGDSEKEFTVPDENELTGDKQSKESSVNRQVKTEPDYQLNSKEETNWRHKESDFKLVKYEPELNIEDEEMINMEEELDLNLNLEEDLDIEADQDISIDLKSFGEEDMVKFVNTFNPNWMHEMLMEDYADEDEEEEDDTINSINSINSINNINNINSINSIEPPKSLFSSSANREFPWKKKTFRGEIKPKMKKNEEEYLLSTVNKAWLEKMTPRIRRLYRKLKVRRIKRLGNLKLTDWDKKNVLPGEGERVDNKENGRIIDRFRTDFMTLRSEQRLMGFSEHGDISSPYTLRKLKPFIRRDNTFQPLWLQVMAEVQAKVNGKKKNWRAKPRATIDFSYVRPQHIPGINSLACQFFWPGIDLTECLQYPDFTCVVLYKKLIIGFGVLVPDIDFEESYISFFLVRPEWRNAGIGTFMLYHLIQTSMGKDVTLHVSATNPALILYQKFGFKIEQFVQDFYDKYMTTGAKESRHALFLRLRR